MNRNRWMLLFCTAMIGATAVAQQPTARPDAPGLTGIGFLAVAALILFATALFIGGLYLLFHFDGPTIHDWEQRIIHGLRVVLGVVLMVLGFTLAGSVFMFILPCLITGDCL